jgi:tRNA(fMet)-specific endonuclease VapC
LTYLLDTNACIAIINGRPEQVRARLERAATEGVTIAVPAVALFELWYGVAKSARREANAERLHTFLAGPIEVLPFESDDAHAAGRIRAALEAAGTPIGPFDLLIAGQAVNRGLTLVTANGAEFARVLDLAWQDWAAS